jgi:negative regulator of flagellin synthesis FlgM
MAFRPRPVEHIMKIGPIEPKVTQPATSASERRAASARGSGEAEPSAKVQLSAASTAAGAAVEDGSFDKAKVDRITAAIREGRFQVDAGAIADKLIANSQEVLGRIRN